LNEPPSLTAEELIDDFEFLDTKEERLKLIIELTNSDIDALTAAGEISARKPPFRGERSQVDRVGEWARKNLVKKEHRPTD
jgi:sulfur transfer protein SufE